MKYGIDKLSLEDLLLEFMKQKERVHLEKTKMEELTKRLRTLMKNCGHDFFNDDTPQNLIQDLALIELGKLRLLEKSSDQN